MNNIESIGQRAVEAQLATYRNARAWATCQLGNAVTSDDADYLSYLRQKRWIAEGWCDALGWMLGHMSGGATCEHCKRQHAPDNPLQFIRDPYIWELDGACVMRWLCLECEEERRDEI